MSLSSVNRGLGPDLQVDVAEGRHALSQFGRFERNARLFSWACAQQAALRQAGTDGLKSGAGYPARIDLIKGAQAIS